GARPALACAVAVQRALADHRRAHGFALLVRIGVHSAEATRRGQDYSGGEVHKAARVAALAVGGEILATASTVSDAGAGSFAVSDARTVSVRGIYPAMWLVMMVLWTGIGVVTWGIAGAVHDTRQAKRLFPLYGSGLILGTAVGGVATAPLAAWLGAENLLLLWAAAEGAAFLLARSALRVGGGASGLARRRAVRAEPSVRERVVEGARLVRA